MKTGRAIIILAIILLLLTIGIWQLHRRQGSGQEAAGQAAGPVAQVQTAPIREGVITEHIAAYGTVIPAPGAVQTVSVPFESQVVRIMVNQGQKVSKGNDLLEIKPSPDTALQLEQAGQAYDLAKQSLSYVERKFELKLATNDQVLQAKQALQQARSRLESLKKRGVGLPRVIHADTGGLIKKVFAQEGAIVPAGNPLLEIVAQNRLEVRLGVEPDDISRVAPGQTVRLSRVNVPQAPAVTGHIRKISYGLDPATRLVDVFVTLPATADFLLDESISGEIAVAAVQGLIVPRSAVLPEGRAYSLFTIKNGMAVKHSVQAGPRNDREVEIRGEGLQGGEPVVVLGNYELKEGMTVKVEPAP
jgi:membrane fusion protein, multidrug efflux system